MSQPSTPTPYDSHLAASERVPPGYRMRYFELYNWGTFHGEVYRVEPDGYTALLTGANGSGKTTLVDGLLTLLVPPQKRFYNQSSGAERKRERSEESYVMGHFGRVQGEGESESRVNKLRPDKATTSSVLLACFEDPVGEQYLSLAQVRYFQNQQLKTVYLIAARALSISRHIVPLDGGQWKKRLKEQLENGGDSPEESIQFFDSFSRYARAYSRRMGMRSEKALSLFNQTVGIKVLGNLNEFIRTQMLEEPDTEARFQKLRRHYEDLLGAHRVLRKTEKQIEMLGPIVETWKQLQKDRDSVEYIQEAQQLVPPYYATRRVALAQERLEALKQERRQLADAIQAQEREQEQLQEQAQQLRWSLQNQENGRQIERLQQEIRQWEKTHQERQSALAAFQTSAAALGLPDEAEREAFYRATEQAGAEKHRLGKELQGLLRQQAGLQQQYEGLQERRRQLEQQMNRLSQRRSNIPDRLLEVREQLLEATGAEESALPFAGELMQVLDEESDWEAAIERLLQGLGLTLIVPESLYRAVSDYVNQNHLGVRLVYQRVPARAVRPPAFFEADTVPGKLALREDSPYHDWLADTLQRRFPHRCAGTMDEFRHSELAITREGQIKNRNRHEKDDRRPGRKSDYVLGWSTGGKSDAFRQEAQDNAQRLKLLEEELAELEERIEAVNRRRDALGEFVAAHKQFEPIDPAAATQQLERLREQLEQLQSAEGEAGDSLQAQLQQVEKQLGEVKRERDRLLKKDHGLEAEMQQLSKRQKESRQLLELYAHVDLEKKWAVMLPFVPHYIEADSLQNLDERQQEVSRIIREKQQEREAELHRLSTQLARRMAEFCRPGKEMLEAFPDWVNDVHTLSTDPQHAEAFAELYERLVNEELDKHRRRFQHYMEEAMYTALQNFRNELDAQRRRIEEHLEALNRALYGIRFSRQPSTYIQLVSRPAAHPQVRAFQQQLAECLPDWEAEEEEAASASLEAPEENKSAGARSDSRTAVSEEGFQRIQALLQRLTEDENWRKTVTDVRHWMSFSAREYHREDDTPGKVYESTGELSGGEKAQLTYTILSAALAYQFGLGEESDGTGCCPGFRFIVVDEAFSKLDPEKSRYLMDLCRQLDFQLLVVTPLDKVHVVEDYIRHCHYVENKHQQTSVVYNLSIEAYREAKTQWQRGLQSGRLLG